MEIEAAAEIERLWNLKSSGAITDEEFQTMKKNLLNAEAAKSENTSQSEPKATSAKASAVAGSPEAANHDMAEHHSAPEGRKVHALLFVGIALIPMIFVWFLLRSGYSTLSRILGFGWLAVLVVLALNRNDLPSSKTSPEVQNAAGSSTNSQSTESGSSTAPVTNPSLWSYSDSSDSMRGTVSHFAMVTAETKLDLEAVSKRVEWLGLL